MENNLIVTVSGGRSSAMMARIVQTEKKYQDFKKLYIFCNTGQERPETIDFVKNIEKYWGIEIVKIEGIFNNTLGEGVSYKIVDNWDDLKMDSSVFSQAISHKNKGIFSGVPNIKAPFCSELMKTLPAKKMADDVFGKKNYYTTIGFRREDMPKRISWAEIKEDFKRKYPLITDFDLPVNVFGVNEFWEKQPFKLEIHSRLGNCRYCFKKHEDYIVMGIKVDIEAGNFETINWYRKEEKKYGKLFFREHKSIDDLVKLAQAPFTAEIDFDKSDDFKCVCNF